MQIINKKVGIFAKYCGGRLRKRYAVSGVEILKRLKQTIRPLNSYNCVLASKEFHLGIKFILNYCFDRNGYRIQLREAVRGILRKYDAEYEENPCELSDKLSKEEYRIWFMWWQGAESMPDTIKACYNRLKMCASGYKVVFISERNIGEYIEIADIILEKFQRNMIPSAILSDYIRVSLLKKYGGLWLDASIYCMHEIKEVEKFKILTGKKTGKRRWTVFFMATNETNNQIFTLLKYYYDKYWENEAVLLDYFFTDFCIEYLYENHLDIREMIDRVEDNNTEIFKLLTLLSEPFDAGIYKNIADNYCFQKLSQKKDYQLYKRGMPTFGNVLLKTRTE